MMSINHIIIAVDDAAPCSPHEHCTRSLHVHLQGVGEELPLQRSHRRGGGILHLKTLTSVAPVGRYFLHQRKTPY